MRIFYFSLLILLTSFTDFSEVCGVYSGEKEDYIVELKLYDDSVFKYTASREFPFEISEGNWKLNGDTVVLTTTPCSNPEALQHPPIRTYISLTGKKYVFRKNTLTPVLASGKLVKSEVLQKESGN